MSADGLRADLLVSVCVSDVDDPVAAYDQMMRIAEVLSAEYRYWELLIVNEAGKEAAFEALLMGIPNLRYLSVVHGLDDTQRRVVGASEAIGDIVLITSMREVASMDLQAMIEEAFAEGAVVLGQREAAMLVEPLIVALGLASGFQASTRDMQTAAYPRTVLNRLLSDPNPVLALRFPPRDNRIKVLRRAPRAPLRALRPGQDRCRWSTRFDLLMRMVTDAGPALLGLIAFLSMLMVVGAILFASYVVIIYLARADVAEGWTTLSLALSGMLGFLGAALFAIAITLRKMAEMLRGRAVDNLVAEQSSVDLFESVAHALNVETDAGENGATLRR